MTKQEIFQTYQDCIMPTYTRLPLIFVKGKGMKLYDLDGKAYLDFFPGWGVSNVGHCHPAVLSAVRDQVGKLIHLPNNYYHPAQPKLAKELLRSSFKGKVFFSNSGAEANEGAIKLARAYGSRKKPQCHEIITFENAFHGRTLATLTATGQKKYQKGFEPLPEGFITNVAFNDFEALSQAVTEKTAAVLMELVQGEGGVRVASRAFVEKVAQLCREKDLLLIIDEVQTGMGRTGKMFAFQHFDIRPDIVTLAKALGGGLPIGCIIAAERVSDTLQPGMHASTFGGSPVVCKAALGVLRAITKEKMLKNAREKADYIFGKLASLKKKLPCIREVRGLGLMIGIELKTAGAGIVEACAEKGLLINCTHGNVLRLMPALNVTKRQIDAALKIIREVLERIEA